MHKHFSRLPREKSEGEDDKMTKVFQEGGHSRSRSVDLPEDKSNPNKEKESQQALQDPNRSLVRVLEDKDNASKVSTVFGYFRANSVGSAESDSGACSRSGSASTGRRSNRRGSQGSGDTTSKGYSSGDSSNKSSRRKASGSSDKAKDGSTLSSKISRVFSRNDMRRSPGSRLLNACKSSKKGKDALSFGDGTKRSDKPQFSENGNDVTAKDSQISSDDVGREKRAPSPVVIYRDNDPSYVHNSLQLHLVMDIFNSAKEECFKMVFRSSMVRYGEPGELPVLVVISNLRVYLFRVVAPER